MEFNTLERIYTDINQEYAEIAKAWKTRLLLYGFIVEAMTELKCKMFSDLPQSVQKIIAMQMLALTPEDQLRSRLAKVKELSDKIIPAVADLPWKTA
jgi:hypothetical protein